MHQRSVCPCVCGEVGRALCAPATGSWAAPCLLPGATTLLCGLCVGGCAQSAPATVSVRAVHQLLKCWAPLHAHVICWHNTQHMLQCCIGIIRQLTLVNIALFLFYFYNKQLYILLTIFCKKPNFASWYDISLYIFLVILLNASHFSPCRIDKPDNAFSELLGILLYIFWYFVIMLFVYIFFGSITQLGLKCHQMCSYQWD
jgi:hypothetical protein